MKKESECSKVKKNSKLLDHALNDLAQDKIEKLTLEKFNKQLADVAQ